MNRKSKTLIEFKDVSKTFSVEPVSFLRNFLVGTKEKPLRINAAKNLSFVVKKGEMIGLYGPNGSGKSTLLRLASGILFPDTGKISRLGTVASVIELGAGLHNELTGSENIELYSTILGIPHTMVKELKQDVIDFSGVGKFLDMPIKYYSTGMRARLATSIAINARSDILLLDEAVAVGDGDFREKFMRTIKKLKKDRAIIFTTHDFGLLYALSDKILLLRNGQIENGKYELALWHAKNLSMGKVFTGLITSNSMYPVLKKGQTFRVRKNKFKDARVGDVIAFSVKKMPQVIVHRIHQVGKIREKTFLITKGDASVAPDAWKVWENDYLGEVLVNSSRSKIRT